MRPANDDKAEVIDKVVQFSARRAAFEQSMNPPLHGGGGGGTSDGMDERVTRLETHFEYVRRDLDDIKADLKSALTRLNDLPTKSDLWQWKWQWTALALAAVAIVIGGIIGGLGWIKPDAPAASPVTPLVVQLPSTPPPATAASEPTQR